MTSSDFICEGPRLGLKALTVTSLTSTTVIWVKDSGTIETWTRPSGTYGDILGTWMSTNSTTGNSFAITFNADGTASVVGNIVMCRD